jgi:hypothetical protein
MRAVATTLVVVAMVACGGANANEPHPAAADNTRMERDTGGGADEVQRTDTGGVLELYGDDDEAQNAAADLMSKHCGDGRFTITKQQDPQPVPGGRRQIEYQCAP